MSRDNVVRLSDSEKRIVEYLRGLNPFELKDLLNEMEISYIKAKIYISEEESITRKEVDEKYFKKLKEFHEKLNLLGNEQEEKALKKIT